MKTKKISYLNNKSLNPVIEMMTVQDIMKELIAKLVIEKNDTIDARTEELINYLLKIDEMLFVRILKEMKNNNAKLDVIDKVASKLSYEVSNVLIYSPSIIYKEYTDDPKVKKEEKVNNIKLIVNSIIDGGLLILLKNIVASKKTLLIPRNRKKNYLHLELKTEEKDRLNKENKELAKRIAEKIFLNNYENLDVYRFLQTMPFDSIESVYHQLPEDIKYNFIFEYIKLCNILYIDDEKKLLQIVLENASNSFLKSKIMKEFFNGNMNFEKFIDKLNISFEDIQQYYRESGRYPYIPYNIRIEANIKTAQDVINELKYFKEERDKRAFIFSVNLTDEELIKLVKSELIDENIKLDICRSLLYIRKCNKEIILSLYKDIQTSTHNEIVKNNCGISIASITQKYDEIFKIIKLGSYSYDHLDFECNWLKFSDEELKEIYNVAEDSRLRARLLGLTRKRKSFGDEEEIFEDENINDFVMVNKENYFNYMKTAKSYEEINELTSYHFEGIKKELTFEQILEIYQRVLKEELVNTEFNSYSECIFYLERMLQDKLTIKGSLKLIEFGYLEKVFASGKFDFEDENKLNIEEVKGYICEVCKIKKMNLREKVFDKILEGYSAREFIESEEQKKLVELNNLYEELLNSDELNISSKYFILSKYMLSILSVEPGKDKVFYEKFYEKFKKLNEESGKSQYTEIFDFNYSSEENMINEKEGRYLNKYNIAKCIVYLNSDVVYDKLVSLYKQNHNIKNCINATLLNEEVICMLDDNTIEFLSRYNEDVSSVNQILNDETKTNLFIKASNRLKTIRTYYEEELSKLADFIGELKNGNSYLTNQKTLDLVISLSLSQAKKREFLHMEDDSGEDKFTQYVENIKKETKEKIHSPLITKVQALDALGTRFFGLSYEQMNQFVHKYASDINVLLGKYNEISKERKLTLEEENELKSLRILRNLREILEIKDKQAILETFEELEKLEEFRNIDFSLSIVLDENMRRVYAKDYKSNVYCLNEQDKLKEKVDGIDIYSPKEFNMLVHVVAAYGDFNLIDEKHPEISSKEIWKNVKDKKNHILCTSYIGNSNLCYAKPHKKEDKSIIFGFSNFSENSVLMAAPYDIFSKTTSISSNDSYCLSSFRISDNMLQETRWPHNEICIERRLENERETNIEPDYLVCFDTINLESKKIAKDFGIPIVLIDSKQVAKNESEKIDKLIKDFYQTNDAVKIEEFLNLYNSNINSFNQISTELVEQYFEPSKMNDSIKKLIEYLDKEYELNNKENAIKCYEAVARSLENEIKYNVKVKLEPEKITQGKLKIREHLYKVKQKLKTNKTEKKDTMILPRDVLNEKKEDIVRSVISTVKERSYNNDR